MRLVDRLQEEEPCPDDEGDAFFHDHDDPEDPSGPVNYVTLIEVSGEEELMVIRSVLIDAGIPFIVRGEKALPGGPEETGRTPRECFTGQGSARIAVPGDYLLKAREILHIRIYQPVSELRVRALEVKLLSQIVWSAVWCASGFAIAYLAVPADWDEGLRLLIYTIATLVALSLGNWIRRSRQKAKGKEKHPWLYE